jgi:Na+-driven multidrug efflux pump
MKDFLSYRRMVTPYIIMVVFWLAVALLIVGLVISSVAILAGDSSDSSILGLCVMWPIGLPLGILVIRIYCELLILFFRMNETLTEIKNTLANK